MADKKLDMDTVPARIHEQLRQVMLGERRRAEKAERERDEALARVRELEADAEEPAALRWLMEWLKEKCRNGEEYSLAACDSGIGIFFTGNILVVKEPTPVALATALDPEWRDHPPTA